MKEKSIKQEETPKKWFYNAGANRYRGKTGKFISRAEMVSRRDLFLNGQKAVTDKLADQLAKGKISRFEWTLGMRKAVHDTHTAEYLAGVGGRNNYTTLDDRILQQNIQTQYRHLEGFETDIMLKGRSVETALSQKQIAQRSSLYVEAGSASMERGETESRGIPTMGAYPGDGQTACMSNCKCYWDIRRVGGEGSGGNVYHAFWRTTIAENCTDCVNNAGRWNPLVVTVTR